MNADRVFPPSLILYDIGAQIKGEDILNAFDEDTKKTVFNVVCLVKEGTPHAFINFFTIMHAEAALQKYPVLTIGHVRVEPSFSLKDAEGFLKVQNISKSVTREALFVLFCRFGTTIEFKYTQRGDARIVYESPADSQRAMRELHGMELHGQRITVCHYVVPHDKLDYILSTARPHSAVARSAVPHSLVPVAGSGGASAAADSDEDVPLKQPSPMKSGGASAAFEWKRAPLQNQDRGEMSFMDCDPVIFANTLMEESPGNRRAILQRLESKLLEIKHALEEKEAEEEKSKNLHEIGCVICMKNRRNCVLLPCMHFILCDTCVRRVQTLHREKDPEERQLPMCPICKTGFMSVLSGVHLI